MVEQIKGCVLSKDNKMFSKSPEYHTTFKANEPNTQCWNFSHTNAALYVMQFAMKSIYCLFPAAEDPSGGGHV